MNAKDLILCELQQIYAQAHARLGVVASLFNTTMVLAGGLAAAVGAFTATSQQLQPTWLLVLAIPFWTLGLMILREDLLLAAGDERFYQVRAQLIADINSSDTSAILKFPPAVKGDSIVHGYKRLTLFRYLVPVLCPLGTIGWYVAHPNLHFTWHAAADVFLLVLSTTALTMMTSGVYRLVLASRHADEAHRTMLSALESGKEPRDQS